MDDRPICTEIIFLPTAREGDIFTGIWHSVHNQPHCYSVTAHPCHSAAGKHPTGMLPCLVQKISVTDS